VHAVAEAIGLGRGPTLMLASVKGERQALWRQQRPCFVRPRAKARSYLRMTPSTTAYMHGVDILNTGGALKGSYRRPRHTLLAIEAYSRSDQTHVATTSRSRAFSTTRCSVTLTSERELLPLPHDFAFVELSNEPLQTTHSSLRPDGILPRD
jgi:hypothetical protein